MSGKIILGSVVCASTLFAPVGLAGPEDQPSAVRPALQVQEESLGRVPEKVKNEAVSPDGKRWAAVGGEPPGEFVWVNGVKSSAHFGVRSAPLFSPDGRRMAYKVALPEKTRAIVVDGQVGPEVDQITDDTTVFSPDSRYLAYVAQKGKKQFLVLDGQMGAEYDEVYGITFSPSGKRWAAVARNAKQSFLLVDGTAVLDFDFFTWPRLYVTDDHVSCTIMKGDKYALAVDGMTGPFCDDLDPSFVKMNADGRRYGYRARRDGRWTLALDGKEGQGCDGILTWDFSPDGAHVACAIKRGEKFAMLLDGVAAGPEFDRIDGSPLFSPGGRRLAYRARRQGKAVVVVDGQASPDFDLIARGPMFSPDGSRLAFVARKGEKVVVVVDGQSSPEYDWFAWRGVQFSADGKHLAYVAQGGGKMFVVLDGKPQEAFERVIGASLCFSPDGARLACLAVRDGKNCAVVDGRAGQGFDSIVPESLRFSADGRRLTYVGALGNRQVVVLDDRQSPEYERVIGGGLTFDSNRSGEYLAIRDGALFRGRWREGTGE